LAENVIDEPSLILMFTTAGNVQPLGGAAYAAGNGTATSPATNAAAATIGGLLAGMDRDM
jgi:hypothetical protein